MKNIRALRPVQLVPICTVHITPYADAAAVQAAAAAAGKRLTDAVKQQLSNIDFQSQPTEIALAVVSSVELNAGRRTSLLELVQFARIHNLILLHPLTYMALALDLPPDILNRVGGRYLPDLDLHPEGWLLASDRGKVYVTSPSNNKNTWSYLVGMPEPA